MDVEWTLTLTLTLTLNHENELGQDKATCSYYNSFGHWGLVFLVAYGLKLDRFMSAVSSFLAVPRSRRRDFAAAATAAQLISGGVGPSGRHVVDST